MQIFKSLTTFIPLESSTVFMYRLFQEQIYDDMGGI